jgi:hypothetical protein
VARHINHNTVLVVASAPGFPHGVVDDVAGIAAAAAKRGVLCHVDGCLGGYLLPFVERLGYDVPVFDFRVPGGWRRGTCLHRGVVVVFVAVGGKGGGVLCASIARCLVGDVSTACGPGKLSGVEKSAVGCRSKARLHT